MSKSRTHFEALEVSNFQEHDTAIVTGDTARWGHNYEPGVEVELQNPILESHGHEETLVIWEALTLDHDRSWYVAEQDLKHAWVPPTDDEIAEVLASIRGGS